MRCPYCVTDISAEALVCPRCSRGLSLAKKLLEKIEKLESGEVLPKSVEARIASLESELASLKGGTIGEATSASSQSESKTATSRSTYFSALVRTLVISLALLLTAHGFLLFLYDVKPLYLRIVTLVIPIPLGVWLSMRFPGHVRNSILAGFLMACVAILSMLAVTGTIDKVPMIPQGARDIRESVEYVAGIGLSFMTGALVGEFFVTLSKQGSAPNSFILGLTRAVTPQDAGLKGPERLAKTIENSAKIAAPAISGAAAIYAGIKAFF